MANDHDATLQIAAVVTAAPSPANGAAGQAGQRRRIVRAADAPRYLDMSEPELRAVRWAAETQPSISQFLGRYLNGADGLDLRGAVALLIRLHQHGFVRQASAALQRQLGEFLGTGPGDGGVPARGRGLMDLPLISADEVAVHRLLGRFGRLLVSPLGLILQTLLLLGLAAGAMQGRVTWRAAFDGLLDDPETLLAALSVMLPVAATAVSVLAVAALAGSGARFVGISLRLTALSLPRLAVHDDDAFLLPAAVAWRYRATTLLLPWTLALLSLLSSTRSSAIAAPSLAFSPSAALPLAGAVAFALVGLVQLCPLYRGGLLKACEAALGSLGLQERSQHYLMTGLFSLLSSGRPQWGLAALASWTLLWLYGVTLLMADIAAAALPTLLATAGDLTRPERAGAAATLILLLIGAAAAVGLRLLAIPASNLLAAASLPIRRVRRGIDSFQERALTPSAAVVQFLREVPILAEVVDERLERLAASLRFRRHAAGRDIVTRGELGDEFFILADGQAQVVVGGDDAPEEVVDVLRPGDSFGEIALIENVRRTATIRALTACKTLVLARPVFDELFPQASPERQRLTISIRQVKLVLESQALSHLTPRQIAELLKAAGRQTFPAGALIIREGEVGDGAYLIENGTVAVLREGSTELARLQRGALIGTISLIKDIRRTASVRAETEVTALTIDKTTFLRLCLSNMFVALLVSDLAERQLSQVARTG